jgi:hypothetical protein
MKRLVNLETMESDVKHNRKNKPYVFHSKKDNNISKLELWIRALA